MVFGAAYKQLSLWERPSKAEDRLRMIRRSAQWNFPAVAWTVHAMGGIAYRVPPGFRPRMEALLAEWVGRMGEQLPETLHPHLLVASRVAASSLQKPVAPIEGAGGHVIFPFMKDDVIRTALFQVANWDSGDREGKNALKRILARYLPEALIYRPGAGFSIPPRATFAMPAFLKAFDEVLASDAGPFADLIDRDVLVRLRERIATRQSLPWYSYAFLWALVFGHHWIVGLESGWG
jgi:hypothetical protein